MYNHLTREQRYGIYLGLQEKKSLKAIAQAIKVSESTVCREIKRHGGSRSGYNWVAADEKAKKLAHRTSNRKLKPEIVMLINDCITKDWSPRQTAGWLEKNYSIKVSHEAIYQIIRNDKSGVLASHCRHKMKYRHHWIKQVAKNIPGRVSIHERPKEADGSRFGDWEMDTIVGPGNKGAILTLTERSTNFILAANLPNGKNAAALASVVWRLLLPYKGFALKTITTDNGSEFAEHLSISKRLKVPVFFADPYSSWQKGAIENANKLIRQYIPKEMELNFISDKKLAFIVAKINDRPREKLDFESPKKRFFSFFD
ncbi:MAG: IS30 family transposase [Paludibacteraceae bacterium]|nr:IS30 family transposase [Paludibacteraceae bacterium]